MTTDDTVRSNDTKVNEVVDSPVIFSTRSIITLAEHSDCIYKSEFRVEMEIGVRDWAVR